MQGEEGDSPAQTTDLVEFGWTQIKVSLEKNFYINLRQNPIPCRLKGNPLAREIANLALNLVSTSSFLEEEKVMEKKELLMIFLFFLQVGRFLRILTSFIEKHFWFQPKVDKLKLP